MNEHWRLEDQLLAIEARVGLLDACRPVGLGPEEVRIQALLDGQARPSPAELVPRLDWPVASRKRRYSPFVVSNAAIAKGCAMVTRCTGPSSAP